ncbi:MAG TPA: DUF6600 domain-containing protein [Chthoniobacterales bacterium]|nr:DUF6600 domain-containing protein [Chthoniobacterales bacterium]
MKKLIFLFTLAFLLLPFAGRVRAQEISVDFFYNNIEGGSWIEVGDYGYCWQPDLAVSDRSWRPYADGYWAYTDLGWTWISYEDFGWATYHYGRWVRLADIGWLWVPGYHWGPAWVSWRFGGNYVGWAPLPPETEVVYESRPLTGHLDVEFDIGPAYYNFVDVRYIGEPVLRSRLIPADQNVTYVTQTVNVTNITYKNKTVYNYGPDLSVMNQYSSRPVQKLKLERQSNLDLATAGKSGTLTKVQGNSLVVAAPAEIKKTSSAMPPPAKVKAKVERPKIEKGWSAVGDENAQKQLKEKIKTQDLKNVPPPTMGGGTLAPKAAGAPGATGSPELLSSPFEKGKGKGKGKGKQQAEQLQPGATAAPPPQGITSPETTSEFPSGGKGKGKNKRAGQLPPGASPIISPGTQGMTPPEGAAEFPGKGKGKNKRPEQFQPGAPSPMTSPEAAISATAAPEFGRRGKGKGREQFSPSATTPESVTGTEMGRPERKGKGNRQDFGPSGPAAASPEAVNEPRAKHKPFEQSPVGTSPGEPGGGAQAAPYGEGRGKHKQFGQPPSQTPAANLQNGPAGQGPAYSEDLGKRQPQLNQAPAGGNQPGPQGEGKRAGEGKGKGAATATPSPQ